VLPIYKIAAAYVAHWMEPPGTLSERQLIPHDQRLRAHATKSFSATRSWRARAQQITLTAVYLARADEAILAPSRPGDIGVRAKTAKG
jgi:hypothetical protein